jgi:hypothetical protein
MGTIEKRFFWIMMCISMILVHIMFIVMEVNVYQYLFWPYIIGMIGIVIFAAIVFARMETIIKKVGPKAVIKQCKKIMSSIPFWGLFVIVTVLFAIDFYLLGQFFIPQNPILSLTTWSIFLLLLLYLTLTVAVVYAMRAAIINKTKD